MMWLLMIILHALAGGMAFWAGLRVIRPLKAKQRPLAAKIYLLALAGLVVFMVGAMVSHWQEIDRLEQSIYSGLVVLGLYMVYRAWHARRLLSRSPLNGRRYIDDVGFTLIALFDGFVIVGAIDLGAPAWLVAIGAVAAVLVGNRLLEREKAQTKP